IVLTTSWRRNIIEDMFGKMYVPGVPRRYNLSDSVNRECSELLAMICGCLIRCLTWVSIFNACDQSSASLTVTYSPVAACKAIFRAIYGPLFSGVENSLIRASCCMYDSTTSTV